MLFWRKNSPSRLSMILVIGIKLKVGQQLTEVRYNPKVNVHWLVNVLNRSTKLAHQSVTWFLPVNVFSANYYPINNHDNTIKR